MSRFSSLFLPVVSGVPLFRVRLPWEGTAGAWSPGLRKPAVQFVLVPSVIHGQFKNLHAASTCVWSGSFFIALSVRPVAGAQAAHLSC